jgi:beta-1,4-mannosyl-glycoprotein beta-1,4-N-acetylglucosaminyltransferase
VKIIGEKPLAALSNLKTDLTINYNYSKRQYPIPFKKNRLSDTEYVIDCCLFMDELEILKLRLQILDPFVDRFIVLESRHTFTGLRKPLHLSDNLDLFKEYINKLHVVVLEEELFTRSELYATFFDKKIGPKLRLVCSRTLTATNIPNGDSPWLREYFNKEFLAVTLLDYSPRSRVVVSDVDEIWNPERRPNCLPSKGVFIYRQSPFVYFMNNLSTESWRNWNGSVTATLNSFIRYGINSSRTHHLLPRRVVLRGGWHFSFQGGPKLVLSKLEAYGHQELNTQANRDLILRNPNLIQDVRGVKAKFRKNERLLPPEVLAMKSRLPEWFL